VKPLKMAVIGAGHLGRIHARLLHQLPQAELLGVVDPDPQARAAVQALCPVPTFARADHLLPQIEAAVVATPTGTHAQVAQHLLARGNVAHALLWFDCGTVVQLTVRRPLQVEELTPAENKQVAQQLYEHYLLRQEQAEPECNQLVEELADFVAAVRQGRPVRVPGTEAAQAVAVAEQIVQQIRPQLAAPAHPSRESTEPAIFSLEALRAATGRREAG